MLKQKDLTIKTLALGIEALFKKNKIDYIKGHACLDTSNSLQIKHKDSLSEESISADKIILAPGSIPSQLKVESCQFITNADPSQHSKIISSREALSPLRIPEELIIIGGGVIGLEMGTIYRRLNTNVTIIEYLNTILPELDSHLIQEATKLSNKLGIKLITGSEVISAKNEDQNITLSLKQRKNGKELNVKAQQVLVCVGRKPNFQGLGLDAVGINMENEKIKVDESFRTNLGNIFAIGDAIKGPMLAHKAEEEGIAAVLNIVGKKGHVNYNAIPSVVYTHPELASVGKTEQQLQNEGLNNIYC
jgi:dihydrolipoamide dehydrogenase